MSATSTSSLTSTSSSTISSAVASESSKYVLYKYTPSVTLAIISIALFGVFGIVVLFQIFFKYSAVKKLFRNANYLKETKKTLRSVGLKIYIPFIIGVLLEIGGYLSRIYSSHHTQSIGGFIAQIILILVSPGMFSATMYMMFHRLVEFLNCPADSGVSFFVKDSLMVKLFVIGDIASFLLQSAGGAIMSQNKTRHLGETIIIIGLFVQLASFGLFLLIQLNFTFRYKKYSKDQYYLTLNNNWKRLNFLLIVSSVCVLIRSVVRVVEFLQGFNGVIESHEFYLYVFDALPMLCVVISLVISFLYTNVGELYYLHFHRMHSHNQNDFVEEFDNDSDEYYQYPSKSA